MKNGYQKMLAQYSKDGRRDADEGMADLPFPDSNDTIDMRFNDSYVRGFHERRAELGSKFKWAGT